MAEKSDKQSEDMGQNFDTRKDVADTLHSLSELITKLEADYSDVIEMKHKLQCISIVFLECVKHSTTAAMLNIRALKQILAAFKKEYEEVNNEHCSAMNKAADNLDADIQQKRDAEQNEKKDIADTLHSLSELITKLEADYSDVIEMKHKLQCISIVFLECVKHSTTAAMLYIRTLKHILAAFKKEYEEVNNEHCNAMNKVADNLDADIQQKRDAEQNEK